MNNYVNKENHESLLGIGFHRLDQSIVTDIHGLTENKISFLDAADWLAKEHGILLWFSPSGTIVSKPNETWFLNEDHRNAAIAHAITIVKERREKGAGNG